MAATNAAGAHTLRYGATRAWVTALDCIFDDGSRALIQRGAPLPEVPAVERFLATAHPGDPRVARTRALAPGRAEGFVRVRAGGLRTKRRAAGAARRQRGDARASSSASSSRSRRSPARRAASWRSSRRSSRRWTARRARASAARARASCSTAPSSMSRGAGPRSSPSTTASEAVLLIEIEAGDAASAASTAKVMEQAMRSCGATQRHRRPQRRRRGAALGAAARGEPDSEPALALAQVDAVHRGRRACRPSVCRSTCAACARFSRATRVRGVIFGHAGDSHVHVNPLIDVRRADWRDAVRAILDEVTCARGAARRHAHGRARRRPPAHSAARAGVGRAVDRALRRGEARLRSAKYFQPRREGAHRRRQSIGDVKYDPTLPPLPLDARAALDTIERDRAWSSFRLSMIGGPVDGR